MSKIANWNPENIDFWQQQGSKIANRNLWSSIPCLLCAFAIWLYWSIITVQMKNLGFPFETAQLFNLSAVAGLTGATLRIPNSFLVAISGGRNVIVITTTLLIIPSLGTGIALQNSNTPYSLFIILAALSGFGGGNFASSMSNISFFFPKKNQGAALGLNAGLGNVGVSVMQVLLPFVMTIPLFGTLSGQGIPLPTDIGDKTAGTLVWIQNCGLVWVPILVILVINAWFNMNNLVTASPDVGSTIKETLTALLKSLALIFCAFVSAAIGLYMLLVVNINMWIVLPITIALTVVIMGMVQKPFQISLTPQYRIFKNKHNWIMTWLYTMTFGSFIGYSAAFPLLIRIVFGELPDGTVNPNAINPFAYAWLGPLVGSLIRPLGGWLSDKLGGANVTHWDTIVMIGSALGVAYYVKQASVSQTPEVYFMPFLILFLILFITTGIGNGSTFRMIPIIFEPNQAGPVLGWTSAVAAYGAFIIPKVFGGQIKAGHPEYALYGFAVYYLSCLIVNWWFYARKNAEISC
ncbi:MULTISPECIES: MFS transporter [Okeania]|uniref:Antiporter n=3 Tax=Okeania TaxID=1458928 RepID=A0A3N6NUY1_9CYAN|nr:MULTISPECIES: MFS transporter [Okeania]NES88628.1 antiporter [Okeania sp. SIO2B9]NET76590.1 antiporter [Okeania sp. SIO1F9]RQH23118.1 antiporter [Okeania hirsuta]RQH45673.1 antiporter [Okeania hirsuta]